MLRNCYRDRTILLAACCFVLQATAAGVQEEKFPYEGAVAGDRVNVRAGSSVNYEILCKLNEGDRVIARSERGGWLEILPPPPVRAWIWGEFIKDGMVTEDSINVRAAPDLRSSVLCQVDKGQTVRVIDQQGEWLGIEPPYDCYVWVSAKFVEYVAPLEPMKQDVAEKLFQEYEARRRTFDPNTAGARGELDELIKCYKNVIATAPEAKTARRAQDRVDDLERIGRQMDRAQERKRTLEEERALAQERALEKERAAGEKKEVAEPGSPPRGVLATGILRRAREPFHGAKHRLMRKWLFIEKAMCYLTAPGMDLDFYNGKKVTVTGVLQESPAGGAPVVEVKNIVLE